MKRHEGLENQMNLFHKIEDCQCIISSRGVYRQVEVYHRGADIYIKHGTGFVKLMPSPDTSVPAIGWLQLEASDNIEFLAGQFTKPQWKP
jgi:hypothetical protein